MGNYRLTNRAVRDLTEIWNYTFDHWSELQADTYHKQLVNAFKAIASSPDLGRNYDMIRMGLCGYKVNRHIIFYRKVSDNLVEITRILHERMDLKNRLK
ncbi:type II toxin-antitoxin system RelE/ParE family toxin [Marinoscillum furvescens]|uniref:Toxin n=1 Tax=Marinoscillum furvescens DSM 4134 TaxID=1122208 RepID=A0A3D9LGZ4_MARFU|nr:type II toxin-antitoxin system RelE/ParE family toxin [Marinoscillum furvescens]REE05887.1 toxin ParE1/3/4 [Marinoscillum furvescens DSM 4134]